MTKSQNLFLDKLAEIETWEIPEKYGDEERIALAEDLLKHGFSKDQLNQLRLSIVKKDRHFFKNIQSDDLTFEICGLVLPLEPKLSSNKKIPQHIWEDRNLQIAILKQNGREIVNVPKNLLNDKEIYLEAIKHKDSRYFVIKYVPDNLLEESPFKEVIAEVFEFMKVLPYAFASLPISKLNVKICQEAIDKDISALKDVPESILNNPEFKYEDAIKSLCAHIIKNSSDMKDLPSHLIERLKKIPDFSFAELKAEIGQSKAFAFSFQGKPLSSVSISVAPKELTEVDIPYIQNLFLYFLQNKPSFELSINLKEPEIPYLFYVRSLNINQQNFLSDYVDYFKDSHLFTNSTLSIGILSALKTLNHPIDGKNLAEILLDEINNFFEKNITYKTDKSNFVIDELVKNFRFLYDLTKEDDLLKNAFPALIQLLIASNSISKFPEIKDEPFKSALIENEKAYLFFHEAMKYNNKEAFELLLTTIGEPKYLYNADGNSFLHLCNDEKLFGLAKKYSPDINHLNSSGNTALHLAAYNSNLPKANFLLKNNADPEIKNSTGQTFWSIDLPKTPDEIKYDSLYLYRFYQRFGYVLKFPTVMKVQKGLNCGFYSASFASEHLRASQPELFEKEHIPARKRDEEPKAKASLRATRKELGIDGQGAIFSTQELAKVTEKNECKSIICDIENFDQFIDVINQATKLNLPVIIPFAPKNNNPLSEPDPNPKAERAHWATIVAIAKNTDSHGILIAHHGKYVDTDAQHLFKSFFNMEDTFPVRYLSKKKGEDWDIHESKPADLTLFVKTDTIPETKLTDFRRKLVIVIPPKFDETLLNLPKREILKKT